RQLQRRLGITTIYVTHDQEEAMAVSDRIVVMSQGSVLAEGSAQDLYHRPGSEFVARFIGRVNLVPARVLEVRDEIASVQALGAVLEIVAPAGAIERGDELRLVLRPEAIEVVRDDAGPRHWTATIDERIFLGEKIEY